MKIGDKIYRLNFFLRTSKLLFESDEHTIKYIDDINIKMKCENSIEWDLERKRINKITMDSNGTVTASCVCYSTENKLAENKTKMFEEIAEELKFRMDSTQKLLDRFDIEFEEFKSNTSAANQLNSFPQFDIEVANSIETTGREILKDIIKTIK